MSPGQWTKPRKGSGICQHKKMKQTTIKIRIVEHIAWADVTAYPVRGSILNPYQRELAKSILEVKNQPWHDWTNSTAVYYPNEVNATWFNDLGERLFRISTSRPQCKTVVREIYRSHGTITGVKICAYLDKPNQSKPSNPIGTWTVREVYNGRTKRIIGKAKATRDCLLDEITDQLDIEIPDHYVSESDDKYVMLFDPSKDAPHFSMTFKQSRH